MRKLDLDRRASRKQAVLLHTIGGWTTNVFLIVQGLVMVPLYLHFLGDRMYGFWLASGGLLGWLSLINVGAAAITLQRCAAAYGRKDMKSVVAYFFHGLAVNSVLVVLFVGFFIFLGLNFSDWLKIDADLRGVIENCFYLAGIGSLLGFANSTLRSLASALQRNHVPVFSQAVGDLGCLVWIFVSLVVFEMGLYALAIGAVVRSAIPFLVNLYHSVEIMTSIEAKNSWSRAVFADYLKTSPALIAAKSSGVFANNLPPVLIARLVGPEATVAYSITLRVVWVLQSFFNHGLAGLYAAFAHLFSDPSASVARQVQLVKKAVWSVALGSAATLPLYVLFNHGFVALWTAETHFAGQMFTFLAAAASFFTVRSNFLYGLGNSVGRIREAQLVQTVEYVLLVPFTLLGVYGLGLAGVPVARVAAALAVQGRIRNVLQDSGPVLKEAMSPVYWIWIPLVAVLAGVSPFAQYLVRGDWISFIITCGAVAAPVLIACVLGFPELRSRILGPLQRRMAQRSKPPGGTE